MEGQSYSAPFVGRCDQNCSNSKYGLMDAGAAGFDCETQKSSTHKAK